LPSSVLIPLLVRLCEDGTTIEEAAAAVACRLATKNGVVLNMSKMRIIVKDLLKCQNPHTCPHGRPILIRLGISDLATLFGRTWSPERVQKNQSRGSEEIPRTAFEPKLGVVKE